MIRIEPQDRQEAAEKHFLACIDAIRDVSASLVKGKSDEEVGMAMLALTAAVSNISIPCNPAIENIVVILAHVGLASMSSEIIRLRPTMKEFGK